MAARKERVTDKRTIDENRTPGESASSEGTPYKGASSECGTADKGASSEGRTPDKGASSKGRTPHEGMSSEHRTTSKPATTMKATKTAVKAAAKAAVKAAAASAAAKSCLRRRYYQAGEYARRYDRDQFLGDHCFAPPSHKLKFCTPRNRPQFTNELFYDK